MGLSRQMTFILVCLVVLSAVIPGAIGYLSARLEAIESAERNLHALEARLHTRMIREARDARSVTFLTPCAPGTDTSRTQPHPPPASALVPESGDRLQSRYDPHGSTPAWLPELLRELHAAH
ncbi:hypothetical protein ACIBO2_48315 [Nonomuraea sp. NPDC050022]|uniref:hypothetical protein n=1 Tax=unclassified Nonomuraea TaxID=2593643 RepID=UPI0033D6CBA1